MERKERKTKALAEKQDFDAMVEEATVDAYNESEQITGLFTMIEDNLEVPFNTKVLGATVTVKRLDLDRREQIVAICSRAGKRQAIPILELPLPSPRPVGSEWIDSYRHWPGMVEHVPSENRSREAARRVSEAWRRAASSTCSTTPSACSRPRNWRSLSVNTST
jgi:Calcium binding